MHNTMSIIDSSVLCSLNVLTVELKCSHQRKKKTHQGKFKKKINALIDQV